MIGVRVRLLGVSLRLPGAVNPLQQQRAHFRFGQDFTKWLSGEFLPALAEQTAKGGISIPNAVLGPLHGCNGQRRALGYGAPGGRVGYSAGARSRLVLLREGNRLIKRELMWLTHTSFYFRPLREYIFHSSSLDGFNSSGTPVISPR